MPDIGALARDYKCAAARSASARTSQLPDAERDAIVKPRYESICHALGVSPDTEPSHIVQLNKLPSDEFDRDTRTYIFDIDHTRTSLSL